MSAPTVQTIETIGGGVATPKGFRAAGVSAGIKAKAGALDLALLDLRPARHGGSRLHDESRTGGAGHRVARTPRAIRRGRAGDRRQQRVRQCLHR